MQEQVTEVGPSLLPSRGPALAATAAAGATGNVPAGQALPSLAVGDPDTPRDHVCAAMAVPPMASLVNTAASPAARALISNIARGAA